jgi:hypothetical protein
MENILELQANFFKEKPDKIESNDISRENLYRKSSVGDKNDAETKRTALLSNEWTNNGKDASAPTAQTSRCPTSATPGSKPHHSARPSSCYPKVLSSAYSVFSPSQT